MTEPLDLDALEQYHSSYIRDWPDCDIALLIAELRATRAERDVMRDDYYNAIGAWRDRAEQAEAAIARVFEREMCPGPGIPPRCCCTPIWHLLGIGGVTEEMVQKSYLRGDNA